MNIEVGKQYVLRNGDVIDIKKSLEMHGRCVFITSQDRICDKDGNDVFVLFASNRMVIEPENKEYDIIKEH